MCRTGGHRREGDRRALGRSLVRFIVVYDVDDGDGDLTGLGGYRDAGRRRVASSLLCRGMSSEYEQSTET